MLGDNVDIVMGQSPKGEFVNEAGLGYPLLNGPTEFGPNHPFPTQFTEKGVRFAEPGDLLFCVRGSTTGRMNWADQRYAIGRGIAAIRHASDQRLQPLVRGLIEGQLPTLLASATGSTFPNVTGKMIASLNYSELTQEEQLEAAITLGQIDDKIELNRRMNETLEEMARALFRDWFVDFGPTRRQIEGATDPAAIMGHALPPEKAATLATLFPAKLGNDGLPEGWISHALGERVTVKRGGSPRPIKDFIRPTGIPWVKIADATRCDGPNLFVTREFIKEEGLKKTVELQPGSLILSNSATPGLPKFLRLRACIHDGWLYFPDTGGLSNEFLYLAFLHFKDAIVSQATGSVFNNLKTEVLKRQEFVFPPDQLHTAFDGVIEPLFRKILANEQENQSLSEMRDLLLPKLMSGEIRLKDVETHDEG